MTEVLEKVAGHYTHGGLEGAILAGLDKLNGGAAGATIDQLAGVDEFHIGGRMATELATSILSLAQGSRVLDVGCGLGGAARFLASKYGAKVEGVDLTPEFVEVGNKLNSMVDCAQQVHLTTADATDLPFDTGSFDAATMFHVGMNIDDKAALFAEIGRVLRPEGQLLVYDVMRTSDDPLAYPVAWAADESTSFLASVDTYRAAIEAAGFEIDSIADRRDMALEFFAKMKARMAESGPPPLGLHIVMGKDAPQKVANMVGNIQKGAISPVQMLAVRKA